MKIKAPSLAQVAQRIRRLGWEPNGRGAWSKMGWHCTVAGAAIVEEVMEESQKGFYTSRKCSSRTFARNLD